MQGDKNEKKLKKMTNENLSLHTSSVKKKLDLSTSNFSSQHLKLSGFKTSALLKETVINKFFIYLFYLLVQRLIR